MCRISAVQSSLRTYTGTKTRCTISRATLDHQVAITATPSLFDLVLYVITMPSR